MMAFEVEDMQARSARLVREEASRHWSNLRVLSRNLDGLLTNSWMPEGADLEYRDLMRKARSPWLRYAARAIAQGLIVDGYSDSGVWRGVWQASGMDGRQSALNEEVVSYGYAFLLVFPGDAGVVMRPLSARNTFAWTEDPWQDSPDLVIHRVSDRLWRVFDDEKMVEFSGDLDRPTDVVETFHGLGVNPVVPILSQFPMDGNLPESLVMPGLPAYRRIVDATFALQMTQRYAGFPQKWQSGGELSVDEAGEADIRPSVDSLLHSDDPTSKFGTFQAADLNQVIQAVDKHIQDLAVFTQIPPHYLLGKVVNLSSEALAATETAYNRLVGTVRESVGEGYEQALRIGAAIVGLEDASRDLSGEVHWKPTAIRALGSAVDAVQKLHATGMPRELSYTLIPDFTQTDIELAAANPLDDSSS